MPIPTLEQLCCDFVCENSHLFSNTMIFDLNQSCICKVVNNFSLYDILLREKFLKEKGFNTSSILKTIQTKGFLCTECHPIQSIVYPHLLTKCQGDGLKWSLSELLWNDIIVKIVESCFVSGESSNVPFAKLQEDVRVGRFFKSVCQLKKAPFKSSKVKRSNEDFLELATLAAKKIVYFRVEEYLCDFLMREDCKLVFPALCQSVCDISVIMYRNMHHVLDYLKLLKEKAKNLTRITIWAFSSNVKHLDDVLSLFSGATSLKKALECAKTESDDEDNFEDELEPAALADLPSESESHLSTESKPKEELPYDIEEFDLMDDALLIGRSNKKFESQEGLPRAVIKLSNIAPDIYVPILEYHFKNWLSLTELQFRAVEFLPRIVDSLCLLLSRPTFKSMYLSNAGFYHRAMEDLLSCVASKRKLCPLDKLMFVNLSEKMKDVGDIISIDHLYGKNDEEISKFVQRFESRRIAQERSFQGVKLFEMFGCSMSIPTEYLTMQYILADTAIMQLCFCDSLSCQFLRITIQSLSQLNRGLSQLILDDWNMKSQKDCDSLVCLLLSVSSTLESLSLSGCLRTQGAFFLQDLVGAIFSCENLKSLDLSKSSIGHGIVQFIPPVIQSQNLRELSLRKISCSRQIMEDILSTLVSGYEYPTPPLDIIDVRETLSGLKKDDARKVFHPRVVRKVARLVLCDKWLSSEDIGKHNWFCVA